MSSQAYRKEILEKLLKKQEGRNGKQIARRVILRPAELYRSYARNNADITKKQQIREAAEELRRSGFVTLDYLKFSTDLEKIYLCPDKLPEIYTCLEQEFGVTPKVALRRQAEELLQKWECAHSGGLTEAYCGQVRRQLQESSFAPDVLHLENNLKMLSFLEQNREELYLREASVLVYGDSKWFEENYCEEICTLIRNIRRLPKEENERNDEVMALYHVQPPEQEICIKGDWVLEWEDEALDVGRIPGGVSVSSKAVKDLQKITVTASGIVLTIENKTSYQRMPEKDRALLYLGGFANRVQTEFLAKTARDNPENRYAHFGDIDVGGFLIHRHLCRATGVPFALWHMGTAELTDPRYRHCLKRLTEHDRARIGQLMEEEKYREILSYMKRQDVKLEQEIVSYYLGRQ